MKVQKSKILIYKKKENEKWGININQKQKKN